MAYKEVKPLTLKEQFEQIADLYVEAFRKKQGSSLGYWVGDRVGEIYDVSDCFINYDDVRFDIDSNQPQGKIFIWYWEQVDCHMANTPTINFENYCKLKKK